MTKKIILCLVEFIVRKLDYRKMRNKKKKKFDKNEKKCKCLCGSKISCNHIKDFKKYIKKIY